MCYNSDVAYTERHLPHWQPEDAALFITWRLHGSSPRIPAPFEHQSAGKAFADVDRELDRAATGPRYLLDERVAQCVADALRYGEAKLGLYELRAAGLVERVEDWRWSSAFGGTGQEACPT